MCVYVSVCVYVYMNACVSVLLLGSGEDECQPFPLLEFIHYWGQSKVFNFLLSFKLFHYLK